MRERSGILKFDVGCINIPPLSERRMRRLRLVRSRAEPQRPAVYPFGTQARHTRMVGEWAHFLVAGLTRHTLAEDKRMPRPRPPLPRLVCPTEEDDRQGTD